MLYRWFIRALAETVGNPDQTAAIQALADEVSDENGFVEIFYYEPHVSDEALLLQLTAAGVSFHGFVEAEDEYLNFVQTVAEFIGIDGTFASVKLVDGQVSQADSADQVAAFVKAREKYYSRWSERVTSPPPGPLLLIPIPAGPCS